MTMPRASGAAWHHVWGHDAVLRALDRALAVRRLSPSLLLSGPPSVGKTLIAERLAQALLCRQPGAPCGACRSCEAVAQRRHPDCVWLEPPGPTTRIPIEAVREALHRLHQTPMEGARHVAVILAIEQLSEESATTLLKTVEEPPPAAHLMLTTQDLGQCLPTIVSRCQLLRLAPLDRVTLAARLQEERQAPAAVAQRLAVLAEGRAGKALRLLDEIAQLPTVETFFDALTGPRDWSAERRGELHELLEQYLWWSRDHLCQLAGCPELAATSATPSRAAAPATLEASSTVVEEALALLDALDHRVNPKLIQWMLQQRWTTAPS